VRLCCVFLLPAVLSSCASTSAQGDYVKELDPRRQPYVIGVSDLLQINVWRDAELTTEATVRPDGTITLPLVGDLRAAGRTTQQLKQEIKQRLVRYVQDPVVTVAVVEVNSYRFTVTGNVTNPGVFSSKYYLTVSQAIALAGGPNRYATPDRVELVREGQGGSARRIPIDYDAILEGDRPDMDIVMLPGDTLYMP
jgi:polysaccharide export outer membrane protein